MLQATDKFDEHARALNFDHGLFDPNRRGAGDDKLFIQFRHHYEPDGEKTEAEGRPCFRDCEFIRIITPGDRDNVIDRPVRTDDKARFARQYAQFKAGESEIGDGTRLEEWTLVSRSMVEELRFFGFRTVEHLAGASDDKISKFPGARQLQRTAQNWLEAAKNGAHANKLQKELDKRDSLIEGLQEQIKELAAKIDTKGLTPAPAK